MQLIPCNLSLTLPPQFQAIQTGTVTLPDNSGSVNAAITAVILNKSFLKAYSNVGQIVNWQVIENKQWNVDIYSDILTGYTKDTSILNINLSNAWLVSAGYMTAIFGSVGGARLARTEFTSSTNIRATRNVNIPPNVEFIYHVITSPRINAQEFQYSILNGSASAVQAISSVTPANSFVRQSCINIYHALNDGGTNNTVARLGIQHRISAPNQISSLRFSSSNSVSFNVHVLDLTNA